MGAFVKAKQWKGFALIRKNKFITCMDGYYPIAVFSTKKMALEEAEFYDPPVKVVKVKLVAMYEEN
jgi:hypothetical protein